MVTSSNSPNLRPSATVHWCSDVNGDGLQPEPKRGLKFSHDVADISAECSKAMPGRCGA